MRRARAMSWSSRARATRPASRGRGHTVRRPRRRTRRAGRRVDLTVGEVTAITAGTAIGPDAVARGFGFDSRTLVPGTGFVALPAARDGHDFVADAFRRGASLAVVERVPEGVDGSFVVVADVHAALQALGAAARDRLDGATVIGITGSAGKTSTKDLTAAALRPALTVHASTRRSTTRSGSRSRCSTLPPVRRRSSRDGGALRREHHQAVHDRAPVGRHHHERWPGPRRAPRRTGRDCPGEGRAARSAPAGGVRRAQCRLRAPRFAPHAHERPRPDRGCRTLCRHPHLGGSTRPGAAGELPDRHARGGARRTSGSPSAARTRSRTRRRPPPWRSNWECR